MGRIKMKFIVLTEDLNSGAIYLHGAYDTFDQANAVSATLTGSWVQGTPHNARIQNEIHSI